MARGCPARTPRSAVRPGQDVSAWACRSPARHGEGRSPASIQNVRKTALDCFAWLAMTSLVLRTAVQHPPSQLRKLTQQRPCIPRVDDILDPEFLRRPERDRKSVV